MKIYLIPIILILFFLNYFFIKKQVISENFMSEYKKSIVCAITGGIGSGKSTVSSLIRKLGYPVISSDKNAKFIMTSDEKVINLLIKNFGTSIYFENGDINNQYLSEKVFGPGPEHQKALMLLNSIVHPAVIDLMIKEVSECEAKGEPLIFVESALTFEAGLDEGFDYVIVIAAKEDIAIERTMLRSSLSSDEIKHRMNQQIPVEKKVNQADFVIENNNNIDDLKKSVYFTVDIIKQLL